MRQDGERRPGNKVRFRMKARNQLTEMIMEFLDS